MAERPPIRYLVLFVTTKCNLRCRYCYGDDSVGPGALPVKTARSAIDLAAASGAPFHVQLTGGEPTLEPGLIERILEYISFNKYRTTVGLQTNGTRVNTTLACLFGRYRVDVGLSVDGPTAIHDFHRGGFKETIRGLEALAAHDVPCRITTVVTKKNIAHLDRLALMLSGFPNVRGIGLDLLVHKGKAAKNNVAAASRTEVERGVATLKKTLDLINAIRPVSIKLREYDTSSRRNRTPCHAALGESLAVYPNGRVYPCSQTAGDPDFDCGTVDNLQWQRLRIPGPRGDCPSRTHYNRGENLSLNRAIQGQSLHTSEKGARHERV